VKRTVILLETFRVFEGKSFRKGSDQETFQKLFQKFPSNFITKNVSVKLIIIKEPKFLNELSSQNFQMNQISNALY